MGIGDKLLDPGYVPQDVPSDQNIDAPYFRKITKCPVRFTDDIMEYIESPEFLGRTLRPLQKKFLENLFSKNEDGSFKYTSGVMCCGMRGGKSWTAGFIATFLTQYMLQFDDPAEEFGQMPGTRLTAQVIASSEVQTKETAYAAIESILDYSKWWQKYMAYLQDLEEIEGKHTMYQELKLAREFPKHNLAILSLHSNSAALAGKTSYCVIFDELSRFDVVEGAVQTKTQKRTADAVYDTASRAASSLYQISKVVTISSPMFEDDFTMKLLCMAKDCHLGEQKILINSLRSKFPNKVANLYGMHATTFELNPLTDNNPTGFVKGIHFEEERNRNPETYKRDYLAIPPATVNPYFEFPERVDPILNPREDPIALFTDKTIEEGIQTDQGFEQRFYVGKTVLPVKPTKMIKHYICVDQAEVTDHFTLAMGHAEEIPVSTEDKPGTLRVKVVIDLLTGWVPDKQNHITVSFQNVEEVIKVLCNAFLVGKVTYDKWSAVESIQRLFSAGIHTERLGATLEMYDILKYLIYQGQIDVPIHERLSTELKQLSLINGKYVDHPPGGSKDYADAICRVAWCCYEDYLIQTIHGQHILPIRQELPTIRSVATAHEIMKNAGNNPHGAIWDAPLGGQSMSGKGVFGETIIVVPNVVPNIGKK